ncbi:MAG: IMP dehydrogenase, partial [Chthoniobacterales bacterium]
MEDLSAFFSDADAFFPGNIPVGLTYDDISLATRYSEILPRDANLATSLSPSLQLQLPILSADMDTVTESTMAVRMALNGGLGLIHYNMSDEAQVKEVARVKNHIHGFIRDPITVTPDLKISDVLDLILRKKYRFSTFPVVDEKGTLLGLLSGACVRERYRHHSVRQAMTPRSDLYVLNKKNVHKNAIETADKFFTEHIGINKLLIVDDEDHLCGLFTLSDIERIEEEASRIVKPARDANFRLLCGAAIASHRLPDGTLDASRIIEHVGRLVDEGVDVVAVSTAHGFSKGVGDSVRLLRKQFPDLTLIAGNVTSAEGVDFLAEAGANCIKIGQGPGSICTTRVVAGVGIP